MTSFNFYKNLDNLCFSDFHVLGIDINKKDKNIQINLEGCWLIKNNKNIRELGKGYIKISNFINIIAKITNSISGYEGEANIRQIKEIKEINEHEIGKNYLTIFGFISDGSWLECKIEGGEVEANFTDIIFKEM